jgi:hypothetical protein
MNNVENFPVDVAEQQQWLLAHKSAKGWSWPAVADKVGVAAGTISPWATGTYQGNKDNIARAVAKYRQMLDSQAAAGSGIPDAPGYFDTPTSKRLSGLLVWAHRGRMTLAATGPGTGKTMTIEEYAGSASNVWVATMEHATRTPIAMTAAVLRSMNVTIRKGWGAMMSQLVKDTVAGKQGLIVVDEANHLEAASLEQIRAWHDATGVGVCLMGNEELLQRIENGARSDAFGRLNSRIAMRHLQHSPVDGDVDAFCEAWGIRDDGMVGHLRKIALTHASGGLRECAQIIEQASMLALQDEQPLSLALLREAQSTRATRYIAA